jgi:hypothetical protein
VLAAALIGAATAFAAAVVLGDYPVDGSVPWVAAALVPFVLGSVMTTVAGRRSRWIWAAAGPLGAGSLAWGVWIATGRGLDPWPASFWWTVGLSLVWPLAWAAFSGRKLTRANCEVGWSGPAAGAIRPRSGGGPEPAHRHEVTTTAVTTSRRDEPPTPGRQAPGS